MRSLTCKALPTLAIALWLATSSSIALTQDNVYALSYFSNAHTNSAPDGVLRLVNDGILSDASPAGDLCASLYVFDTGEHLNECCSCKITPNGILSLSVNNNLTSNTLTGNVLTRGIVKVLSSLPGGGICDPTAPTPNIGIHGWQTHIQNVSTTYSVTEAELTDSSLGLAEAADLAEDCQVLGELGGGAGICSCIDSQQ
jgi:hypothetical protein